MGIAQKSAWGLFLWLPPYGQSSSSILLQTNTHTDCLIERSLFTGTFPSSSAWRDLFGKTGENEARRACIQRALHVEREASKTCECWREWLLEALMCLLLVTQSWNLRFCLFHCRCQSPEVSCIMKARRPPLSLKPFLTWKILHLCQIQMWVFEVFKYSQRD